jgi:hypothetical protein
MGWVDGLWGEREPSPEVLGVEGMYGLKKTG